MTVIKVDAAQMRAAAKGLAGNANAASDSYSSQCRDGIYRGYGRIRSGRPGLGPRLLTRPWPALQAHYSSVDAGSELRGTYRCHRCQSPERRWPIRGGAKVDARGIGIPRPTLFQCALHLRHRPPAATMPASRGGGPKSSISSVISGRMGTRIACIPRRRHFAQLRQNCAPRRQPDAGQRRRHRESDLPEIDSATVTLIKSG